MTVNFSLLVYKLDFIILPLPRMASKTKHTAPSTECSTVYMQCVLPATVTVHTGNSSMCESWKYGWESSGFGSQDIRWLWKGCQAARGKNTELDPASLVSAELSWEERCSQFSLGTADQEPWETADRQWSTWQELPTTRVSTQDRTDRGKRWASHPRKFAEPRPSEQLSGQGLLPWWETERHDGIAAFLAVVSLDECPKIPSCLASPARVYNIVIARCVIKHVKLYSNNKYKVS